MRWRMSLMRWELMCVWISALLREKRVGVVAWEAYPGAGWWSLIDVELSVRGGWGARTR